MIDIRRIIREEIEMEISPEENDFFSRVIHSKQGDKRLAQDEKKHAREAKYRRNRTPEQKEKYNQKQKEIMRRKRAQNKKNNGND